MICVDTNPGEDSVFSSLQKMGENVERKRMDVGDVLISFEESRVCLERKTWSDFSSSICDGRYKEQKERMVEEETTYVFAIEGAVVPPWEGKMGRINNVCLWGAVVKTSLRDGMPVFHTSSSDDTARLCSYILKQMKDGSFQKNGKVIPGTSKRKRENLSSPSSILRAMLVVIPGMSISKADCILSKWGSVSELAIAKEKDVSDTVCSGRRIGPKLAASICSVFSSK